MNSSINSDLSFTKTSPADDELLFCPLGGAGEIGMNLNVYGHAGKWLMIDCGITFGDEKNTGVEIVMPDVRFIEERKTNLIGIVLTHAHEDHFGAVHHLWNRLRCNIYATAFAAELLKKKLEEVGLLKKVKINLIKQNQRLDIGPFQLRLFGTTHSIPEPNSVVLKTSLGTVLHTGDYKLDPYPLIGKKTDLKAFESLGDDGVLALVGDSTNSLIDGSSGSEKEVRDSLFRLVGQLKGRVVVACFASNVARIQTIIESAERNGRSVVLSGRSLKRVTDAAKSVGYLRDVPAFIKEKEAKSLPRENVLIIATGSQGEPRSALSRIARDDHSHINLDEGDVVIFSSRIIPGNERAISKLHEQLAKKLVTVITEHDHLVHVSGHPAREEIKKMYEVVRPTISIPVHGESHHLRGHAELAKSCDVPFVKEVRNGDVIALSSSGPEFIGRVHTGRLMLDGNDLISMNSNKVVKRNHMQVNGFSFLTIVIDQSGAIIDTPMLAAPGLLDNEPDDIRIKNLIIEGILVLIDDLPPRDLRDDEVLVQKIEEKVLKGFKRLKRKSPSIEVHLVRVKGREL
ncbi:MAG: MBL fold hydrolase [Alphaproteobacteria bacterium]|jgi:ribonuclease J|nr:MBL fold hydrolase [Alphaproteobacteria bacterium]PPR12650.1 MAG: Ribonuclease J [Alphaproteobacteria bacterium MarineAlpha12_Bin1]|tara:strand:- start:8579 stop:10291 length:1713 start_codon:yes stop_codon:yes gene_type:complete